MADRPYGTDENTKVRIDLQRGSGEFYDYPQEDTAPLEPFGGVDIRVYKIKDPVAFLESQKNLHRPQIIPNYRGESALNGLRQVFSRFYQNSRKTWQRLFSPITRVGVTKKYPVLKQAQPGSYHTELRSESKFMPLAGYEVAASFRYPVLKAKPFVPETDAKLQGSSSEFIPNREGDVSIPLGKLAPGLYLTEATYGDHAAYAVVFVSDTILVTKTSPQETFVWSANLHSGATKSGVKLYLTDGVSRLAESTTSENGVARFLRPSPEKSYIFGVDDKGGVSVSENYYFDSEIYGLKVYMHTDRPLYQPGDQISIKVFCREFLDALKNKAPESETPYSIKILDPRGRVLLERGMLVAPGEAGGDFSFVLPENAMPGGYAVRLSRGTDVYASSFRVRRYVKPVYEVTLATDKKTFATGENVTGKVVLRYPNGKPLKNAVVRLVANSQKYTMMSGRLVDNAGRKTLMLDKEFKTDSTGSVTFSLPQLEEPSRYIIEAMATDSAYAKVSANLEVLVRNGDFAYQLVSAERFTKVDQESLFNLKQEGDLTAVKGKFSWQAIRGEDQSTTEGSVAEDGSFKITFKKGGSYSIRVLDENKKVVVADGHWVSGSGVKLAPQTIRLVADKEEYAKGEKAKILIAFSEPVDEALVTLERDAVHSEALLSKKSDWISLEKITADQYRAEIPITDAFAPNISFSVLTVAKGQYYFSNKGLKVRMEPVKVSVTPDRQDYHPGEKVTLKIQTTVKGENRKATLSLSVVDEMVYVMQPEIAPSMADFFYHPRRNQVRTVASLDFHSYNISTSGIKSDAQARADGPFFRPLKLRERPRRDDRDTAAFFPLITTDEKGEATVTFVMPDSLTRWRVTARAMDSGGLVGQDISFVQSSQDVYLKWLSDHAFREGDAPVLRLVAFNQTQQKVAGTISLVGAGMEVKQNYEMAPGENSITIAATKIQTGDVDVAFVSADGKITDALKRKIKVQPQKWTYERSEFLPIHEGENTLTPREDFSSLKVRVVSGAMDEVSRIAKQLMDYPFGCIEQVTSRILPLAILMDGLKDLPRDDPRQIGVRRLTETGRARLLALAGPDYHYGWWGDSLQDDALMTAYANLSLFETARVLGVASNPDSYKGIMSAYEKTGTSQSLDQRAFAVWVVSRVGLSAQNLAMGVAMGLKQEAVRLGFSAQTVFAPANYDFMSARYETLATTLDARSWQQLAITALFLDLSGAVDVMTVAGMDVEAVMQEVLNRKMELDPMLVALAVKRQRQKTGALPQSESDMTSLLRRVSFATPTLQRALTLLLLTDRSVPGTAKSKPQIAAKDDSWTTQLLSSGAKLYHFKPGQKNPVLTASAVTDSSVAFALEYESTKPNPERQAVEMSRQLFALTRDDATGEYRAKSSGSEDWEVTTDGVYLEVIELNSSAGLKFNVLDVPLVPGANIEPTTWGMRIPLKDIDPSHIDPEEEIDITQPDPQAPDTTIVVGKKKIVKTVYLDLVDSPTQERDLGYAVPFMRDDAGHMRLYRLIRFRDAGQYQVPSARLMQMYSGALAFEKGMKEDAVRKITIR